MCQVSQRRASKCYTKVLPRAVRSVRPEDRRPPAAGPRPSWADRYFGLLVVYTTVAATIFFGVGGALGSHSWRAPFWLYLISRPLAVAAARWIWQPAPHRPDPAAPLPPLPWRQLAAPVGVSLVGGLVFYALIVELSCKLDDIGV